MLDPLGALLFTLGLLLTLFGLSWGGQLYAWNSGQVIGTLVSGIVILVAFVLWEIYGAGEFPLIPMKFFKNAGYLGVLGISGIGQASWAPIVIIWPIQLTVVWPNSFELVGWKSCIGKVSYSHFYNNLTRRPLKLYEQFNLVPLSA